MSSVPVSLGSSGPLSRQWLAVARPQDVVGAPAAIRLLGRDLVLWRSPSGAVVAAPDRCTHSKGDLTNGEVTGGLLACPKHGWTFGDEGRCVFKPSGLPINDKAHLKIHQCAERHGVIWVALGDPAAPLVDIDPDVDESYRLIRSDVCLWRSNPIQVISSVLAQPDSPFDDITVDVPFTVRSTSKSDDGTETHRLLTCAPVDNRSSLVTAVVWTNRDSIDDDQAIMAAAMADLEQARADAEGAPVPLPAVEVTPNDGPDAADWKSRLLGLFGHPAA